MEEREVQALQDKLKMTSRLKTRIASIIFILGIIGPGIITSAVDNDAGGITTYSIAGAHFGYSLLWSLIPITLFLIIFQEICARMGAITGKGLADLIRERFGLKLTMFIMIGLVFANLFITVSEFAGIAAVGQFFGISKLLIVPLAAMVVLGIILWLNYRSLEKVFLFLILFYFLYAASAIMAKPDWALVFKETFVPSFSLDKEYLFLLIGIIGTTITPWMQFYLQSSIVEKGIKVSEYRYSRWDVIIGSIFTDVIAFFIIVTCAAVLFTNNISIETAIDGAKALVPLVGSYAGPIFALGFFGSALFGAFILPISTAFYVSEAFGWESGVNKTFEQARGFYIMLISIVILSASIILIPQIPLVKLIVLAQVVNGIILPLVLIPIILLSSNERIMKEHVNPRWLTVVSWIATGIIIIVDITMIGSTLIA